MSTTTTIEIRAAAQVKKVMGVPNEKFEDLVRILEDHGVSVSTAPGYNRREFHTETGTSDVYVIGSLNVNWVALCDAIKNL